MNGKILLTGEFDKEDLKLIAKTLRKIESRNPKGLYGMLLNTPTMTMKESASLVKEIYDSTLSSKTERKMTCKYLEEKPEKILRCRKKGEHALGRFTLGCEGCKLREESK